MHGEAIDEIEELIGWLNASKSAPFDLLEKVKSMIMG
jgi:hypothetical protein